ncbi:MULTISPECIES: tail fiber assembly protein [Escherichia]|nr:tail fiber assembly protein [Escherichia ruysiae]MBY7189606.1 tail fiber assembly protein [Escherichia ruysiae]MBY7279117.1 tail fiber assembly protein [Escherichia ruysiae]MCH7128203.1 hypothetical protein [Escherichia coli]
MLSAWKKYWVLQYLVDISLAQEIKCPMTPEVHAIL